MRLTRPASRRVFLWLTGLTIGLWALYILLSRDSVLGQGWSYRIFNELAVIMTAVLMVTALAELTLNRALRGAEAEPTAFMRILVYGVLAFAATFVTLRYLGFELREVFATSAIVTAAVGFAMQPTLASMFSGLALHLDHVIRVGDGVMHDGQWVEVRSLGWRSMTGRTTSGRVMVIPNARLSDQVTQVAPADRPMQAQFHFLASVEIRPDILFDLITEMMIDLPLVEEALPIVVAPVSYQPHGRASRYQVKYWLRSYANADDVLVEAHRRLWYVFQRNALPYPESSFVRDSAVRLHGLADTEVDALVRHALGVAALKTDLVARLCQAGDVLLFAVNEYLIAPARTEGRAFLVLQGEADTSPAFESPLQAEAVARLHRLSRGAAVRHIALELAGYIGPYAEFAVSQAARDAASLMELCHMVAKEIADPAERKSFLDAIYPDAPARVHRGAWLDARRNAAGSLICGGGLRARRETILLAIPKALAQGLAPAGAA